ncbi:MAG: SOS response-associated peptidase [Solirubrobacterales bacterium]
MCGRYTLTDPDPRILRLRFGLSEGVEIEDKPRFNIAPTDPVLAIRRTQENERDLGRLRWGLVPPGATPKRIGRPLINARAESIDRQPAFRGPFAERRCLLPADGFYEWRVTENGKQPVWISLPEGEMFSFAGLWAKARDDHGAELHSCTLITTVPSEQMRPIHNRMPVILPREAEAIWLDPEADLGQLRGLLRPREGLEIREVSDAVNDVRDDGPHLVEQAQPEPRLF